MAPSSAVNVPTSSITYDLPHVGTVTMRSYSADEPIAAAKDLLITGGGYPAPTHATEAASRTSGYLQMAFARLRIGADFGRRAPAGGGLGYAFRAELEAQTRRPLLDDIHGAMVFPCEPTPRFFRAMAGSLTVTQSDDALRAELARAAARDRAPSEAVNVAYDLFSASFTVAPSADARFLMLMMALETLIDPQDRPAVVLAHVDALINATEDVTFAIENGGAERQSLLGSLRWLKKESISRAGKKLAARLGEREYTGEAPTKFFESCYDLRSKLVHGHVPRPPREMVGLRAANLEIFVSDLIGLVDET